MLFDHHFGNVEAKSYPATILAVDLGETLKDGSNLLRGDARSGVAHRNLHVCALRTAAGTAHADFSFGWGELDGVSNQIRQDLHDAAAVANHIPTSRFGFGG
jgi:hypothetical protein